MTRRAAALAVLLVGCGGASDREAPAYGDPGPACPTLDRRLERSLTLLRDDGAPGLRTALSEGLGEREAGRLVELVAAVIRALPPERSAVLQRAGALDGALAAVVPAVASALDAVAGSPDITVLGDVGDRVLSACGISPVLATVADVLVAPSYPAMLDAAKLLGRDEATLDAVGAALFTGHSQRNTFPALGFQALCFVREIDNDLGGLVALLKAFLGDTADRPTLALVLDELVLILAPGTPQRASIAPWAGCYLGSPASPELVACATNDRMPDSGGVLMAVVWDVLASDLVPLASQGLAERDLPDDPAARAVFAAVLHELAADGTLSDAWNDVVGALLTSRLLDVALRDMARLLRAGLLEEWLGALRGLSDGCAP